MENVTEQEKSKLRIKLLEFEKHGLESYGKYLLDQLEYASKSKIRASYKRYIENQIISNNEKIKKIENKLQ
ncbi:MAG: hypothetical protein ACI93N_001958 [Flavobacteriaceae bacterium]|jgi:hypothetical protein